MQDAAQLSSRKAASADLALFVYKHSESPQVEVEQAQTGVTDVLKQEQRKASAKQQAATGAQHIMAILDGPNQKLRELPSLAIGLLHDGTGPDGIDKEKTITTQHRNELLTLSELQMPFRLISTADRSGLVDVVRSTVLKAS